MKELIVISALWCPSCLITGKHLKKISEEYNDIKVIKYDYDLDEEIVKEYNIGDTLPVMIYKKDDDEIARLIGEKNYEEITSFIEGLN